MVAMLGPESDLEWVSGDFPVQLAFDGRRSVQMDRIERDSEL
jgi:hypothetical protein